MATTVFKSKNSVTTLLAIQNQLQSSIATGFSEKLETTINTKRNVYPSYGPHNLNQVLPRIRYFGIGIKGFANLTSDNNIAQPYMPSAEEYDLYEPIPFRCVTTPLTGDAAAQYRMVTTSTINGVKYYLYWLKCIAFETAGINLTKITPNGESTYTMDSSANLNPTPSDLFYSDVSEASTRIVASITGVCRITGAEVLEAINILYGGDVRRARISEIGTYSGIDISVGPEGDIPARTEAAYVQLNTHECSTGYPFTDVEDVVVHRKVFENGSCVII